MDPGRHSVALRKRSHWLAGLVATLILAMAALLLVQGVALANHGSPWINLTTAGANINHSGALFVQGGIGAGTGTFDPFLTLSTNAGTERGYNTTEASGEFDTFFGGGRTHPLQVAAIPAVDIEGTLYRELSLDANDQGADDYMSITELKVWYDNQSDLTDYNGTGFTSDSGTPAVLVYDMDTGGDTTVLMRSQSLTPGSGVSDITVLIRDDLFPASCFYGSLTCGQWFYLYTNMGTNVADGDVVPGTQDWNVTAGFEEWRTRLLPVVNVTKTAVTSVTQDYDWTVDKKVKVDGSCEDAASVDLFNGETQTAEWCIDVTRTLGEVSDARVSGTITITNPTDGDVITSSIPAKIMSVTDVISGPVNATVDCPVTFPYTLGAGDTLECTYSGDLPDDSDRTNTATVTIETRPEKKQGQTVIEEALFQDYAGTANISFADATVNEINDTATLTDTVAGLSQQFTGSGSTSYTKDYSCDSNEGANSNTATITPGDGGAADEDTSTLTLNCHEITVTKNATTSRTRTYEWDIDKSVTPATWDLFTGETGTSEYTVTVTKTGFTDSAWAVTGAITVSNAGNPIPATINSVTDVITGPVNATVDCGAAVTFPHVIDAGGTLVCTYSAALSDGTTRTNTATATQQLHDYDEDGAASDDGTSDESGTASVNFAGATLTEVNATVNVTDTVKGNLGAFSATGSTSYSSDFTCDDDEGTNDNTATIVETQQSDSASVTVNCYDITVTKDADTTFTRTWTWDIDKVVDDDDVVLALGQSYFANYTVTVSNSSEDSDWAATGTITVSNAGNPIPATIKSVSDVITGPVNATVDCGVVTFPHVIDAGGTLVCTYSAALSDGTTRTNTATATQQLHNYDKDLTATAGGTSDESGTANVTFGSTPTTAIDECIDVTDSVKGALGTVCAGDPPADFVFEYEWEVPTAVCGVVEYPNIASFVTNDTAGTGQDGATIRVTIECPEGCTLTQGYWKTHSALGPAPFDDTWNLLGDVDGDGTVEAEGEEFFDSGMTYYEVLWTAPKGGNAYFILAHQYIAAQLNFLNDADPSAAQAAFNAATTLFEQYTSADFDKLKGKNAQAVRAEFLSLAGTLGSYNEGAIGPGHCDEDGNSVP